MVLFLVKSPPYRPYHALFSVALVHGCSTAALARLAEGRVATRWRPRAFLARQGPRDDPGVVTPHQDGPQRPSRGQEWLPGAWLFQWCIVTKE